MDLKQDCRDAQKVENKQNLKRPVVLVIGGFDGSSGAGVSADLRMVHRMGGYGLSVLTALTVQDHDHFHMSQPIDGHWIRCQLDWLLTHYPVKAVKIGMLARAEAVGAVADSLAKRKLPLVVDPVLASSSGARLLDEAGLSLMMERLLPMATLITPNFPEAKLLFAQAGERSWSIEDLARRLSRSFETAVLLKGGHVGTDQAQDLLIEEDGRASLFTGPRIEGVNSHGTGCRLASSVATSLAMGERLRDAVSLAKEAQNELFRHPLEIDGYGAVLA